MAKTGDLKTGRLTNQEKRRIEQLVKSQSVENIADELGRRVKPIQEYVDTIKSKVVDDEQLMQHKFDLRSRHFWPSLQASFTEDELRIFEADWCRVIQQFDGDVKHTEETQIKNYCTVSILMSRALQDQKVALDNIAAARRLYDQSIEVEDHDMAQSLLDRIGSINISITDYINKYKELFDRQQKILSSMKSSRDQRVQELEKKATFFEWLLQINEKDRLDAESKEIAKHSLAMEKELKRLGEFHKYADDKLDKPFLNHITVEDIDEE